MALDSYQVHGEHVFLNGNSAKEVMQKALDHMEYQFKSQSRVQAFDDCTEYWKSELMKITVSDCNGADKWQMVMKLFNI